MLSHICFVQCSRDYVLCTERFYFSNHFLESTSTKLWG